MKTLFLLICLFGTILTVQDEYGVGQREYKISDKLSLERQRDLLQLFQFITEPDYDKERQKVSESYSIEENADAYNSSVVKHFVSLYKQGLLPRGEIFSIFHHSHLKQAISLFKLFYCARDFEILYKTAVWARNNVNEGLFLYSFSTALVHREDTFRFILPPIYEIYPFYFFTDEHITMAQKYKQKDSTGDLIYANYSGFHLNKEQSISYYLEDVGLNSFYYYCNIYYPFWMDGEEFKLKNDRRGEQYYYLYQQFLARYHLERLSNGLEEIEPFNYEEPFKYGYRPSLRYPNGIPFPSRPNFVKLTEYTKVRDIERRIRDAIDSGHVIGVKNGTHLFDSDRTDLLGNLVESNPDSVNPRYYGPWQSCARRLLGYSYRPSVPSALEHFETALRDPAFYQLYKRMLLNFQQYKSYLPPYTYDELYFPGVNIGKVDVDRLFTYFDYFDSDVTNAIYKAPQDQQVKIRQRRLNHKPFTYRISVSSNKANDAIVRVHLGPKSDPLDLNENRVNFVELDTFRYKLEIGENTIERNSREFYWYVPDRTSHRDLYRKVLQAIGNTESLRLDSSEAFYGFPNRLLLPKGKPEGQLFQIYVIINQYQAPDRQEIHQEYYFHKVGTGMNYMDNYAFGFPFDRTIARSEFNVSNSKFQDVIVYHKSVEELNSSHK